jgi:hypothetical protein
MKKALLLCFLLLGARWVLGGETDTIQGPTPITASATPAADPTWSFESTTSYTSGARIMKAGYFGSQAEVLIWSGSIFRDRTVSFPTP